MVEGYKKGGERCGTNVVPVTYTWCRKDANCAVDTVRRNIVFKVNHTSVMFP